MVILRTRNKITDFLMILAWASPFNLTSSQYRGYFYNPLDPQPSTLNPQPLDPQPPRPTTIPNYPSTQS